MRWPWAVSIVAGLALVSTRCHQPDSSSPARSIGVGQGFVPVIRLTATSSLTGGEVQRVDAAAREWSRRLQGCVSVHLVRSGGIPVVVRDLSGDHAVGRFDPNVPELVLGSRFVGAGNADGYTTALHEIGHVLGLGHQPQEGCATSRHGHGFLCEEELAQVRRRWNCLEVPTERSVARAATGNHDRGG